MRPASFGAVLIMACAAMPARAGAPSGSPSLASASVRAAIDAAVQRNAKLYGGRTPVPGVLIGVWDASGHRYVRGFGYADVARKRPLSAADHFRIGSNTKTFIVGVILQLIDEGKLRLDDPLSRFAIGVKVPNAANITVRMLCDMRSGLFEAYDAPQFEHMNLTPNMKFDPRTVIGWAVKQKPYFPPNKGYHYSNTNYLLLGLIIENLTKHSDADEIRTRFIEPLHLTQTSYPDTQAMPDPWARGYGLDARRNWKDVSGTIPVSLMGSAGAMISDMADVKRWITLFVTGKVSKPATGRLLVSSPVSTGDGNLSFGLALGESAGWYGYTGGLPGYNTANYYFPAKGITIVDWVDVQQGKPFPGVANAIFKDIARIMTPKNVPFMGAANKSGL
jgi:D-alanyl-D-alanine carboxypeptidase